MKKSISAILVAALMLFAFTACEQQMPTITGDPVGMTATVSKTNYLVGQEVDLSTVSATVDFSGNVSKTFAGTELTFFGDKEITAGENTLTIRNNSYRCYFDTDDYIYLVKSSSNPFS